MLPAADFPLPPLHGYRGDPEPPALTHPLGLTVAISRQAGARGETIARKVGELLGWQVFDQETIDCLIQNESARDQLLTDLPDAVLAWANSHMSKHERELNLTADPDTTAMVRLLLVIAARGDAVIVGRGAGFLLPLETTLHVRVIAPLESRIAYFAQMLRLSQDEAAAELRAHDDRRSTFLIRTLGRNPADSTSYDVVVNAGRLGIEAAAQFIGWAVRTKQIFAELADSEESSCPRDRSER
jgi:cytidylate kinase